MNRILFAGTPDISVPLLKKLAESFNIVGVLTSTDKMQGRSATLIPSPVKVAAIELGLPVLQFDSLKSEARQAVSDLGADTLVTFAFGKIFGPKFLSLFPNGTFNVHPSALPVFRGPSPIQSTILNSLKYASVSIQEIGEKMDEGDIFARLDFVLEGNETTSSLTSIVADKAAEFVPSVLKEVLENGLKPEKQKGSPSYCKMLDKEDAILSFDSSVKEIHSRIRAVYPWPKAMAKAGEKDIFICGVYGGFDYCENPDNCEGQSVGKVVAFRKDRGLGVACKDGILWITALQLPSKKKWISNLLSMVMHG